MSSIKRDTALNIAGLVFPVVISLATIPTYVRTIGDVRFGILTIVLAVLGYFSIFDLGLVARPRNVSQ